MGGLEGASQHHFRPIHRQHFADEGPSLDVQPAAQPIITIMRIPYISLLNFPHICPHKKIPYIVSAPSPDSTVLMRGRPWMSSLQPNPPDITIMKTPYFVIMKP
jgi:hypothetical protein